MIHDTACASVILEARLYLNKSFSFDVSVIGSVALLTRGRNKLVCSSFLVSFFSAGGQPAELWHAKPNSSSC